MTVRHTLVLLEPDATALLRDYGIPYPDHGVAHDASEAVGLAARLGYPVVLKVVSPAVIHKSDVGGVATGLKTASDVQIAFDSITLAVHRHLPDADIQAMLVCREASAGLDVIVGALNDAVFGPTIMFGLGGVFTEILKDVAFRIAPLRRRDAEEMIRETHGFAVLQGARGHHRYDVEALVDLLLRVSRMATEIPDILEMDLNPVRIFSKGLVALDVRISMCEE